MVDPHIKVNIPKISFRDVAGMKEAKQEVMEFVEYMKRPEKFAVWKYLKKIPSEKKTFISETKSYAFPLKKSLKF